MIAFEEGRYYLGLWFIEAEDGSADWLGVVSKQGVAEDDTKPWLLVSRIRQEVPDPDNPDKTLDRVTELSGERPDTSEEGILAIMDELVDKAKTGFRCEDVKIHKYLVQGDVDKMIAAIKKCPFFVTSEFPTDNVTV